VQQDDSLRCNCPFAQFNDYCKHDPKVQAVRDYLTERDNPTPPALTPQEVKRQRDRERQDREVRGYEAAMERDLLRTEPNQSPAWDGGGEDSEAWAYAPVDMSAILSRPAPKIECFMPTRYTDPARKAA
jgi:hypothetical protein